MMRGKGIAGEADERLLTLFAYAREAIVLLDPESGIFVDANPAAEHLFGWDREAMLARGPLGVSPPRQPAGPSDVLAQRWIDEAVRGGAPTFEWWHLNSAGERFPCEVHLITMPWEGKRLVRGSIVDITSRKLQEMSELGRRRILDDIARGASLTRTLARLIHTVEQLLPGMVCSVLLLEREHGVLRFGAAPSLPSFYNKAVDGLPIGPQVGSCGAAAFTGKRVIVSNIFDHPNWARFRDYAQRAQLRACWSEPIFSLSGEVLGTFAMYYADPLEPAPVELRTVEAAAVMAAEVIQHARAKQALVRTNAELERRVAEETQHLAEANLRLQASEQEARLAAVAFDTHDSIVITDKAGRILRVNSSFTELTGYHPEEVIGRTPNLLKSGKHEDAFYHEMWRTVRTTGFWDGEVWNRRKDGSLYLQRLTIASVRNAAGETTHYVGDGRDITDLKQAEADHAAILAARTVQTALFPARPPRLPGFEIAGAAFPADNVSGDCFDFLHLCDNCLGVYVADVSGHGLAPALRMAQTQAYLSALAASCGDPGVLLTRANRLFVRNDSGHFVTLFLLRLCAARREFTYSGAGHQGHLLTADGRWRILPSTGLPLGVTPDAELPASTPQPLTAGDLLVLTTDGVEEAFRPDGEAFGRRRLQDVVSRCRSQSAEQIVHELHSAAVRFSEGRRQIDDITAIVIKVL